MKASKKGTQRIKGNGGAKPQAQVCASGVEVGMAMGGGIQGVERGEELHPADGEEDQGSRRQRAPHPKVHSERRHHGSLPPLLGMLDVPPFVPPSPSVRSYAAGGVGVLFERCDWEAAVLSACWFFRFPSGKKNGGGKLGCSRFVKECFLCARGPYPWRWGARKGSCRRSGLCVFVS